MSDNVQRRRAAILAADVVGYSRLTELDEAGTLAAFRELRREAVDPAVAGHGGRLVKTAGDGLLIEFAEGVAAVRAALEIQRAVARLQADVAEDRRILFRIGINAGDIVVEDGDVLGDGVNIAARLEGMAEPGGILIAQPVQDAIAGALDVAFVDNGNRKFKNIARAIRVWSWPRRLPSLRAEGKPRLLVSEFEGGTDAETRLAADLGAELRAHLARLTGLAVTEHRDAAHYVLDGSVRLGAGKARLFARLTAIDGARQVWSDRYDEASDDPFEILDRCAPRIVSRVRRRVNADDAERAARLRLDELSFEELLALAGARFYTPTRQGWEGAGELAEQALELVPDNFMALAMAAAGLGLAEFLYGWRRCDEAVLALALQRAETGLRRNNRSDMLHCTHAGILLLSGRDAEAMAAARYSVELNPDYNMGHWVLGMVQLFTGDSGAGLASEERAVAIDPQDPYVHLYSRFAGYAHFGAGQDAAAADWFLRADQLTPGLAPNLIGLAACRWRLGKADAARDAVARLLAAETGFRLADAAPLPYRDAGMWQGMREALADAGVPA